MSEPLVFMMGKYAAEFPTDRKYAKNHMWGQPCDGCLRFGFTAQPAADEIHREPDKDGRQQSARQKDPVGQRRDDVHWILKSASTSPPPSPIVTTFEGRSPCAVSFHTVTV